MAIQIGTVDGLINISKDYINCFTNAIYNFTSQGGIDFATENGIPIGTAFQRYVEPVYNKKESDFNIASITIPALTGTGNEQSPARLTFCRKMGLLNIKDDNSTFQLTPIALELHSGNLTTEEYAFILMTKQGIFKDGVYKQNLFSFISNWFKKSGKITDSEIKKSILELYGDVKIEKSRIDIILNALAFCGLIKNVKDGIYVLANLHAAKIFNFFAEQNKQISDAIRDDEDNYTEYIGSLEYGIFDILTLKDSNIFTHLYPNIHKYIRHRSDKVHKVCQTIYYGAPGTGKSKKIRDEEANGLICHRTTFHPDTDYASFVGCYKPQMVGEGSDKKIEYAFETQVFMDAYIKAWNDLETHRCLVIEELNRGNCAQIFGDIFQLLDRDEDGFSKYPIIPDKSIRIYLNEKLNDTAKNTILERYKPEDPEVICMALPSSLSIKATMNTSDQSLYPMDSAFKRRWDWEYISISYENIEWELKTSKGNYLGKEVVKGINKYIAANLHSADKQIGSHFIMAKGDSKEISFEEFRDKVLFYLFNDVFKDDDNFHNDFGGILMFEELFDKEVKAEDKTIDFIQNVLGVNHK